MNNFASLAQRKHLDRENRLLGPKGHLSTRETHVGLKQQVGHQGFTLILEQV